MNIEIKKLHNVWLASQNKPAAATELPKITFDDLTNSIISTGPFYYYVVDFYDMSLSNVSSSIGEIHGLEPDRVSFNDILGTIHPDDVDYIARMEALGTEFFSSTLLREKLLHYKINYNFRAMMKDGEYALLNHQSLMLTLDKNGGLGKSLNIHTRIDHLTDKNTYQYSLIGLNGEPSYLNLNTNNCLEKNVQFSPREIEVIRHIADGLSNVEIGIKLHASSLTIKKHRDNILKKANCRNTAHLIKTCILQGLI